MSENRVFVVLHGRMPHSDKDLVDYVAHIVYGNPRVDAVQVGSNFAAILEYSETQAVNAKYTFERMGSFSIGAQYMLDADVALREFGIWVRHDAPGTIVGFDHKSTATITEEHLIARS
jgi:hypothetical protein